MVSKSALIFAVGAVSALSVGAGTYLAYRANQTSAPVVSVSSSPSPIVRAPESPAPSPESAVAVPASRPAPPPRTSQSSSRPRVTTPVATSPAPARVETTDRAASRGATGTPTPNPTPVETPPVTAATPPVIEATPVPEPPKPRFEEVTVKGDSVIGIRIDQALSSDTAKVEDRVTAKITRDVTVDGRTALAAGTRLEGVVTIVERGGKIRERARLGIRFNTLVLADNVRVPVQTEAILREGEGPAGEAGSKIGAGAIGGAIVGGLLGGKRGAIIGSTAGAAGGTAVVMSGGRNAAIIASGSPLTVRLTAPVTILVERDPVVR